jgi:hypothetical protein
MATRVINLISLLKDNGHCDDFAKSRLDIAISHLESLKEFDVVFWHWIIIKAFNMVDMADACVCQDCDDGEAFDLFNEILGELDDMVILEESLSI